MSESIAGNLFSNINPSSNEFEIFELLADTEHASVERIISNGQATPEGQWLEQDRNEWVALLRGNAAIEFESGEVKKLESGDYLLIPSNIKHRVKYTSADPLCVWIAFHFD